MVKDWAPFWLLGESMTWHGDIGIISGRYHSTEVVEDGQTIPRTVIELFGRSKTGQSICLLIEGLSPTFEVASLGAWDEGEDLPEYLVNRLRSLGAHEDIVSHKGPVMKLTDLGMRPTWQIEVKQPYLVPQLRKKLQQQGWSIFSGDIPYLNRIFLDLDLGMHVSVEGQLIDQRSADDEDGSRMAAVIEAGGVGRYPVDVTVSCNLSNLVAAEPFPVPFKVFSFDLETSIAHNTVLCGAAWIENMENGTRQEFSFIGTESHILEQMTLVVRANDPDIITGYNIDNFDLPRLFERTEVLAKKVEWRKRAQLFGWGRVPQIESELKRTRAGLMPKRQSTRAWNIAGRAIVDCWWQARIALKPQRETLSFVSKLLFPDDDERHKMDIDASNMDVEWANRPDEVLEYCIRDAALPLDILNAIQVIRRKEAVASVAKVNFDTAANGSTSQLIDSLVIRLADSKNIAVPLTGSADAKEGQITGGYVHDVEAGLHPWIAVLDFKSMYPSIMIGHNICYTTRVDSNQDIQPAEDDLIHTAPTGAKFLHQDTRKGLIPLLLEDLMAQRDQHKAGMKTAKDDQDDNALQFHDSMQYAVKILMNSFYGVFASGFYRFTHRDLGSSITAWARHNIKAIIASLEEEDHSVVYSDTDSIFVRSPVGEDSISVLKEDSSEAEIENWNNAKQAMITFGLDIAQRFSKDSAVLEFEKGLSVFFSHGAKKRYVGQVVWPSEEMLIRGYETQRTDTFSYLRDTMKQMFNFALADEGEELVQYALSRVQAVKNKQVDASELVLSKSCKGKLNKDGSIDFTKHYANPDSMAQVRIARALIKKGLGFTPGMKVAYIVSDASNRPMNVEPWLESEVNGGISGYDEIFYAERTAAAIGRITEAFGWSAKELVAGNRQTSLFSF